MTKFSVVIQAGGESRRMGQDKALLPFRDGVLIERVVERVASIADELLITTNTPENYQFLNIPLYPDIIPGRGALGGLFTALNAASHPLVSVVACDMAFVNSGLLKAEKDICISTNSDLVIPDTDEGLEPFHAVYRRQTCLPEITMALQDDRWRVDSWFNRVQIYKFKKEYILKYDPDLLCFFNINTLAELEEAESLAAQREGLQ